MTDQNPAGSDTKKLLVIDDDASMLEVLQQRLETEGYDVETAQNGVQALQLIRSCAYDLVITDIVMPDMDGIELIRALREEDPDAKIIAISGGGKVSSQHYLHLADRLGADCVLAKPFVWQDLSPLVDKALAS